MPTLKEILPIEDNRQDSRTWNKIHLFRQGQFWHAYDWSAWMVSVMCYTEAVRKMIPKSHPLKVTRMERTDKADTYCRVGFPTKSIEKFIPVRKSFESIDDDHVIVTISLPDPKDGSKVSYERLNDAFHRWMGMHNITEKKEKKKKAKPALIAAAPQNNITGGRSGNIGVGLVGMIISYPLSERNAIENIQFIQQLKNIVTSIL